MKALLRLYEGQQFVYVDVVYKDNNFYIKDTERIVNECDIIDISYDTRKKYVICCNCGEMVKNTPDAIKEHWMKKARQKDCLKCNHLYETRYERTSEKSYKKIEGEPGKYVATKKYSVFLKCNAYWRVSPMINTPEADEVCQYYKCKNASYRDIVDTFITYPHLFDVLPTVDMLIQKRWKYSSTIGMTDTHLVYHHPSMKTLTAYVNSKGIVSHFNLKTGNNNNTFMYSKRYDKFFYISSRHYSVNPVWAINSERKESAEAKVKELFNEVN